MACPCKELKRHQSAASSTAPSTTDVAQQSQQISPSCSMDYLSQPVLPWLRIEQQQNRRSIESRSSLDTAAAASASLHVVKRQEPSQKKRQRWSSFKWWVFATNTLLFCYGLGTLLSALLTFFKYYLRADVVIVGERTLLNMVTATGLSCLSTSLLGYVGIMLNDRVVLTFYNILLWVCFGMIAAIGYIAYRKNRWNIEGKLSYQWHYELTPDGRARIQANLHCCGYKTFSDFHERSNKCYPRTLLPGCRFKYQTFTKQVLTLCWIVAFSIVPLHVLVLVPPLLCSNHINRKFDKGLPPKIYRLDYRGIVAGTPSAGSLNLVSHEKRQ